MPFGNRSRIGSTMELLSCMLQGVQVLHRNEISLTRTPAIMPGKVSIEQQGRLAGELQVDGSALRR